MPGQAVAETVSSKPPIDFLWLELTNQCNLKCTHCYAESGPKAQKGTLSASQYVELMTEAHTLGCRSVQFIGGEPTLNRDLPALIRSASKMGFEFIEVFTNLTRLSAELLQCFVENGVHVATSVYSAVSDRHDAITLVNGSFEQTTRNIQRVVKTGLPVRASIVEMGANAGHADATIAFLREIGVDNANVGRVRRFGRWAATCEGSDMSELCGNCAGGTLCVSSSGQVSPCIMSKQWAVGSIAESSLSEIATSNSLFETRQRIYDAVANRSTKADGLATVSERVPCHSSFGGTLTVSERLECHPVFSPATRNAPPPGLTCERFEKALRQPHLSFCYRNLLHSRFSPGSTRSSIGGCAS